MAQADGFGNMNGSVFKLSELTGMGGMPVLMA
jgi:hypothetical protein